MKHGAGVLSVWGVLMLMLSVLAGGAHADSAYALISHDDAAVYVKDGRTGETLFRDADPLKAFEWAMMNHRITVIGEGEYRIAKPLFIPRPGISLIIDESATVRLDTSDFPRSGVPPFRPRLPVIYNGGHDDVTLINLGNLVGEPRSMGSGIFYDGRNGGGHGLRGGRIVHAGMMGWTAIDGPRPGVNIVLTLVDCADVELPLVFGDGYRIAQLEAEGCRNLDVGLAVIAPRASTRGITLTGLNEDTRVRHLVARQPMESGVLVRNSPRTVVERAEVFGDPIKYIKIVHAHEYHPWQARFTQRPFISHSEGSFAREERVVDRKVADWKKTVDVLDFPQSLPTLRVKVELDAVFEDGGSERVIDEVYDLELLSDVDFAAAPEFLFITTDGRTVRAVGGDSGQVRYEDADARKVIEWAMAHAPITVLEEGVFTVSGMVTIPRENVSLVIGTDAELRQDPDIDVPEMPGGRGGYRTLIYNPGYDDVEVVNLGTLRAPEGHRGVAIHFDGRTDRDLGRREFIEAGREGILNIDGGMIFAAGPMYGDDVVWVVDAKNIRIPVLLGYGYSNTPLALEGVEDSRIGTLAALMGSEAFENEAVDFNSFCQRVHIERVIATTPTEEAVDVNNSPDCVIDEVVVYRTAGDVKPLRIHDWPDRQLRSPRLMSERPEVLHSEGSELREADIVEQEVAEWFKSVEVTPLAETLPRVELRAVLSARFEDGTEKEMLDEIFSWEL